MKEWYEQSFGADYLIVYRHRDMEVASREVRKMIRWLGLPPGSEVLDLCCGMGRHSLALAEAGFRVTGLDLSEALLEEAKKADHGRRVTWVRGDMRKLPFDNHRFEAVVNLFTSFGYFAEDGENGQVLREIRRVLKDGGPFLIDYLNPEHVVRNLVPFSERTVSGVKIREYRSVEDGFVKKKITLDDGQKGIREYWERVRLYSRKQMEQMLADAGLAVSAVYGGYDQEQFDHNNSPRMIFVGRAGGTSTDE